MTDAALDWAPGFARPIVAATVAAAEADPGLLGLTVGGSAATGTMDEFSDVDFVLVCRDEDQPRLLRDAPAFAAALGPLLACFTGEHVGEPRLLIALYGPPLLHVDLKFVAERDLDVRVEDGRVLWQRDGALDRALARAEAVWPRPDPQWIEDRFWIWIHYGATKAGRGEVLECHDMLAALRRDVLGPLIAEARGHRPAGVRRLERIAPDLVRRWRRRSATPRGGLPPRHGGHGRPLPPAARRRCRTRASSAERRRRPRRWTTSAPSTARAVAAR